MDVEPVFDDVLDHIVGDEVACVDDPPHPRAQLRAVLHVPAKDVSHGDMDDAEAVSQQFRLGSLPTSLWPHDDVFSHPPLRKNVLRNPAYTAYEETRLNLLVHERA